MGFEGFGWDEVLGVLEVVRVDEAGGVAGH